jgi:hypothetical protein
MGYAGVNPMLGRREFECRRTGGMLRMGEDGCSLEWAAPDPLLQVCRRQ